MKKIESFARRRLAQLESEVFVDLAEIESTTEPVADLAASTFESALEAAGWVCALDGPHEQVDRFLSVAARAGLRLLEAGSLATDEANPWSYVRALYAAVVAGEDEASQKIAAIPEPAWTTPAVHVSKECLEVVRALSILLRGDEISVRASDGVGFWPCQMRALLAIQAADREALECELDLLCDAIHEEYGGVDREYDADGYLALPVLGLAALGVARGLIDPE